MMLIGSPCRGQTAPVLRVWTDTLPKAWCLPLYLELFPEVKIAVSGECLGRVLPSTLNISINYFRPVSVKMEHCIISVATLQAQV